MAEVSDPQRDYYSRLLTSYQGRTMKRGARGKTVRALQLFLRDKGYDIAADGDYGRETEKAVRDWQKAEGLSSDGQAGRRTLTKVRETVTPRPRQRPSFTEEAIATKGPTSVSGGPLGPALATQSRPPPPPITGMGMPTPSGGPGALEGVPPGVGANVGALEAARQAGDTAAAATMPNAAQQATGVGMDRVMQGPAPGVLADSFPVGAGGARPDPTRRPLPGAEPPLPPPPEDMPVASATPDPLTQALAGGGGMSAELGGPMPPPTPPPGPMVAPPMSQMPPGPETAMQLAQLPPLNQTGGHQPGALAAGGRSGAAGEMTPETIALIQALLSGQMPPDQSVPAF
jgi:peptidoglycan hydrolase-like protein with peptidoglycan-binding domain